MKPCLISLSTVTHIGTLDPTHKGNQGPSHEGLGVSFSLHPEDWEAIARLGGNPWWEADVSGCRFLDGHAFVDENQETLKDWGLDQKLIEIIHAYSVRWHDDELEQECEMLCQTREEALDQLGEFDLSDSEINEQIQKVVALTPTQRLVEAMGAGSYNVGKPSLSALPDLATVWAQREGLDGVWWEDELLPEAYSAPRGVIFPDRVSQVSFRQTKTPSLKPRRRP